MLAGEEHAIEVRGFAKRYGELEAVKGISFVIERGEIFGFLGPNGAGKSTTMRALHGAAEGSAGSIRVLGYDPATESRELKRHMGIVPQDINLEEMVSCAANLVVHARYYGIPHRRAQALAKDMLASVGLLERADALVNELSGGMQRRLLIARALMSDPELLILDEPTTGLDPQSRALLWSRIRAMRDEGRTVLLTTHYMDEAEKLCDRLVIIDHGKIIAEGTPRDLIAREIGRDIVEVVGTHESLDLVRAACGSHARGVDRFESTLLLYADDGETLMNHVTTTNVPVRSAQFRRATLEDVFLKLTGRRLDN